MTILAKRVEQIKPSFTLEMVSRAADLKSKGVDLINFSAGHPDFNTPKNIIDAAKKAMDMGATKYTAGSGTLDLRKAICLKIKRENIIFLILMFWYLMEKNKVYLWLAKHFFNQVMKY